VPNFLKLKWYDCNKIIAYIGKYLNSTTHFRNMFLLTESHIIKCSIVYMMLISTFFLVQSCGVTDSDEPNVHTIPFEIVVPVVTIEPGRYNVLNGRFSATFTRIDGASSYTFRVISEDGTIGEPDTRELGQLTIYKGMLEYAVTIGNHRAMLNLDRDAKDHYVNEFTKELEPYRHIYHKVEVAANQ